MALTGRYKRFQIRRKRGVRLGRSILLAGLVGVVAGLGAVVFHLLCLLVTHVALNQGAHYEQGGPQNEIEWSDIVGPAATHATPQDPRSPVPWMLILVPTLGGINM